eukprot:scaffold25153_cov68-Phaeocystis_antarctica.AAC.5
MRDNTKNRKYQNPESRKPLCTETRFDTWTHVAEKLPQARLPPSVQVVLLADPVAVVIDPYVHVPQREERVRANTCCTHPHSGRVFGHPA